MGVTKNRLQATAMAELLMMEVVLFVNHML